jgi:hypothetical protein
MKIENEFIPYEQALALKELGFDEPCLGRWLIITEWEAPTGEIKLQLGVETECYDKNQCTAPLYQQAFRWLYQKLDIENGTMPLYTESQHLLLKELIDKVSSKRLLA